METDLHINIYANVRQLSTDMIKASKDFGDALEKDVSSVWKQSFGRSATANLVAGKVAGLAGEGVGKLGQAAGQGMEGISQILSGAITSGLETLVGAISTAITGGVDLVVAAIMLIPALIATAILTVLVAIGVEAAMALMRGIDRGISGLVKMFEVFGTLLGAMVRPFANLFIPAWLTLSSLFIPVVRMLNLMLRPLYQSLMEYAKANKGLLTQGATGIMTFNVGYMMTMLVGIGNIIKLAFIDVAVFVINMLADVITALVEGVIVVIGGTLIQILTALGNGFTLIGNLLATLLSTFGIDITKSDFWAKIFGGTAGGQEYKNVFQQGADSIRSLVGGAVKVLEIGKDSFKALVTALGTEVKKALAGGYEFTMPKDLTIFQQGIILLANTLDKDLGDALKDTFTKANDASITLEQLCQTGGLAMFKDYLVYLGTELSLANPLIDAFTKAVANLNIQISMIGTSVADAINKMRIAAQNAGWGGNINENMMRGALAAEASGQMGWMAYLQQNYGIPLSVSYGAIKDQYDQYGNYIDPRRQAEFENNLALGSYQFGGLIPETGLYKLHAGEEVVPKGGGSGETNVYLNFNVTGSIDKATAEYAVKLAEERFASKIRQYTRGFP